MHSCDVLSSVLCCEKSEKHTAAAGARAQSYSYLRQGRLLFYTLRPSENIRVGIFGRVEGLINKHSSRRLRIQGLLSLWRWQQQRCISLYLCSGEEEAQGATGEREEQVG